MNLLQTYLKIILVRNRFKYLYVVLSTIMAYIIISLTIIYIDNILFIGNGPMYNNLRYIYISIRTMFFVAGISFVLSQYCAIMRSCRKDYNLLKELGATKNNIRIMIIVQACLLIIVSIPIGLYAGCLSTGYILHFMGEYSLNHEVLKKITSSNTFFITAGLAMGFIVSIGVILERELKKKV